MEKANYNKSWNEANKCLFDGSTTRMNEDAVSNLVNGLSLKNLNSYDRLLEAVNCLSTFLKNIVTTADFTHIFNLCYHNEKFVFILLYPFLLKPLGKKVWTTLLPHFHLVTGSFSSFMKDVAYFLKNNNLNKTFITFKKTARLAVGVSGVGLLALFSNYFSKQSTQGVLTTNSQAYKGIDGLAGSYFKLLNFMELKQFQYLVMLLFLVL